MRYARIFLLHFQDTFNNRAAAFVWGLLPFLSTISIFIFWIGAFHEKGNFIKNWSLSYISSYYLLLIVTGSFLIVHIEQNVAKFDIQGGELTKYLLKPFSYFWFKFFQELPWRIVESTFAFFVLITSFLFLGSLISFNNSFETLILSFIIFLFAFFISFMFKMILGISALWITDFSGLSELIEVIMLVFAGLVIPLDFLPNILKTIAYVLPFSYIIYFPVIAILGKLSFFAAIKIIGVQMFWLSALSLIYSFLWKKGIRKFTAFGQ